MGVANCKTVPKSSVEEMIERASEAEFIISEPIEHYTKEEIIKLAEMAKKNDLIFSIREERSNFYQGILLQLLKRSVVKESNVFISHL